jgi:hypothetical protein
MRLTDIRRRIEARVSAELVQHTGGDDKTEPD